MVVQPSQRKGGIDNRQRFIDAGYQVLSEQGIEAVRVKELARVAGVSPGLFHYYFTSKDEFLLAVFETAGERFREHLLGGENARLDGRERITAAVGFIERLAQASPELFRLRYEIYALGLRREEFLAVLNTQLARTRDSIREILGQWFPEATAEQTAGMAAVILACFDGLALQQIAGEPPDLRPAYRMLGKFMETEFAP